MQVKVVHYHLLKQMRKLRRLIGGYRSVGFVGDLSAEISVGTSKSFDVVIAAKLDEEIGN